MPDWRGFVRERLGPLGLSPAREREIFTELADHLEDEVEGSGQEGLSPLNATRPQGQDTTDWRSVAREIRIAEEETMTSTAKTLWVPGTSVLIASAVLLLVITRLVPPATWVEGNGPALLISTWLFSYLVFGALGAYWSRRAGGDTRARFLSGVFPVTLHLAVFILPIVVAILSDASKFPEHRQLGWLVRAGTGWVVIPGIVLAIGTLPFLRDSSRKTV